MTQRKAGEAERGPSTGTVLRRLEWAWSRAADFVLPPVCLHCRHPLGDHDALCAVCWRSIDFIRAPLCDRLGIPLPYDDGGVMVSAAAVADPPVYDRARAAVRFDGAARDLVHRFKYADSHDCRRLFAKWMSAAGQELLTPGTLLLPVPLHRWRLLKRRYNQAALLARELAAMHSLAWSPDGLIRIKATAPQVGASRDQRRRNMAAAFAVRPSALAQLEGRDILLIDDVITTGATADACARALRRAGVARIDVLAVAMVPAGST